MNACLLGHYSCTAPVYDVFALLTLQSYQHDTLTALSPHQSSQPKEATLQGRYQHYQAMPPIELPEYVEVTNLTNHARGYWVIEKCPRTKIELEVLQCLGGRNHTVKLLCSVEVYSSSIPVLYLPYDDNM